MNEKMSPLTLLTGEDGLCGPDAAHVDSSLYLDVALVSPVWSPGVLPQPVVNTILSAVTNHHRCMADLIRL